MDLLPVIRCPATFGVLVCIFDLMARIRIDQHQIGMIALTDKATAVDAIQDGWIMAHQLHQQRPIHDIQFSHQFQGMLDGWKARFGGEIIASHLLFKQMWRMVGANGVDQPIA